MTTKISPNFLEQMERRAEGVKHRVAIACKEGDDVMDSVRNALSEAGVELGAENELAILANATREQILEIAEMDEVTSIMSTANPVRAI